MKLTELFTGAALDRAAPTRRSTAWTAVRTALESAGAPPGSLRSDVLADHALDALSPTGRP
eukprot:5042408-Alexandrium_andersonii.AAC.1